VAVRDAYLDLPVETAARRFAASREFRATLRLVQAAPSRRLLDLGAGNGISSFAFAQAGWNVDAVEPNPSDEVGAGAIRRLAELSDGEINVHQATGEHLPVADGSMGAVYGRQVLHHLQDLEAAMCEARRVLQPRGLALFVREHVVDDERQLAEFLAAHPLHARYGGEHAYPEHRYLAAARGAGFEVIASLGTLQSPINAYPMSELRRRFYWAAKQGQAIARDPRRLIRGHREVSAAARASSQAAGRLFAFLLRRS
jgi:SAM-dependent methyltransferase